MKRFLLAAVVSVAALSLPVTSALADGYERRYVAKPKPKPKIKRHAKKHYRAPARDYAHVYPMRSHSSVTIEEREEVSTSYYSEVNGHRVGPIVSHYERYVNPQQGCYPNAPCTWGYGPKHPPVVSPGWGWWGHPGGVGYGVDGGYHGEYGAYLVPGAWSTGWGQARTYDHYSRSYGHEGYGWRGGRHQPAHPGGHGWDRGPKHHPGMGGHHGGHGGKR